MTPCLVPDASPLGQLEGPTNMVVLEGDSVGQIVLRGAGAGEGPTASAVMADVCDLARGARLPVFGVPATELKDAVKSNQETPSALVKTCARSMAMSPRLSSPSVIITTVSRSTGCASMRIARTARRF